MRVSLTTIKRMIREAVEECYGRGGMNEQFYNFEDTAHGDPEGLHINARRPASGSTTPPPAPPPESDSSPVDVQTESVIRKMVREAVKSIMEGEDGTATQGSATPIQPGTVAGSTQRRAPRMPGSVVPNPTGESRPEALEFSRGGPPGGVPRTTTEALIRKIVRKTVQEASRKRRFSKR